MDGSWCDCICWGYRTADSAKYYTDSVRCNYGGVYRFFVFTGVIPGIMLALSDAFIIVGVSLLIKLPRGKFEVRAVGRTFLEAWPALLMPVVVLGGLYGGLITPTEAGAAAAGFITGH